MGKRPFNVNCALVPLSEFSGRLIELKSCTRNEWRLCGLQPQHRETMPRARFGPSVYRFIREPEGCNGRAQRLPCQVVGSAPTHLAYYFYVFISAQIRLPKGVTLTLFGARSGSSHLGPNLGRKPRLASTTPPGSAFISFPAKRHNLHETATLRRTAKCPSAEFLGPKAA